MLRGWLGTLLRRVCAWRETERERARDLARALWFPGWLVRKFFVGQVLIDVKTKIVTANLLAQAGHETDSRLVWVITSRAMA